MTAPVRICAILLAAGSGTRAGGVRPKQHQPLGGRPVLDWSLRLFADHPAIHETLLVIPPGELTGPAPAAQAGVRRVAGGASRRASVRHALDALAATPAPPDIVLVHDAARPGVDAAVVDRLVNAVVAGAAGAMPVLPVVDTLVAESGGQAGPLVDRARLQRVQTPQAFAFRALLAAHHAWNGPDEPTDDAQMLRAAGGAVVLVAGDQRLEKITLPGDVERMERLLAPARETRLGTGFDVHRLVRGEPLWLCGIRIPHSHGLAGHSDADVAIHALVDALLGALAEGDIGSHFPPGDPQWRGAPSGAFLQFAARRVAARGGRILHVDVTLICEAPKIGPHRDAMRSRLAELLAIHPARVSVKATTTERLGLTGRREGIAAQAAAGVDLPALQEET